MADFNAGRFGTVGVNKRSEEGMAVASSSRLWRTHHLNRLSSFVGPSTATASTWLWLTVSYLGRFLCDVRVRDLPFSLLLNTPTTGVSAGSSAGAASSAAPGAALRRQWATRRHALPAGILEPGLPCLVLTGFRSLGHLLTDHTGTIWSTVRVGVKSRIRRRRVPGIYRLGKTRHQTSKRARIFYQFLI